MALLSYDNEIDQRIGNPVEIVKNNGHPSVLNDNLWPYQDTTSERIRQRWPHWGFTQFFKLFQKVPSKFDVSQIYKILTKYRIKCAQVLLTDNLLNF